MITDRIMPIAMFLFFLTIGMNGFIVVSGQMLGTQVSPSDGHILTIAEITNLRDQNVLGKDMNLINNNITDANVISDQTTANADYGMQIWALPAVIWNGITGVGETLLGVKGVEMVDNMLFGTDKYLMYFASEFDGFEGIFYALEYLLMAVKILVVAYAGSILVRAIVGRRI